MLQITTRIQNFLLGFGSGLSVSLCFSVRSMVLTSVMLGGRGVFKRWDVALCKKTESWNLLLEETDAASISPEFPREKSLQMSKTGYACSDASSCAL